MRTSEMNKLFFRFHCFAALFLLALPCVVRAQFTLTLNNNSYTITGYTGSSSIVVIPAATNGHPVTAIGVGAFENNSVIDTVTVPDSVTNIEASAFDNSSLTTITTGNGVTAIGNDAFNSSSLTDITIGSGVTTIGNDAFYGTSL